VHQRTLMIVRLRVRSVPRRVPALDGLASVQHGGGVHARHPVRASAAGVPAPVDADLVKR
jgi:hypothetical protein